ncbi:MAG: HAD family hydrolase [Desulfovibrionaceae bacterium]
MKESPLKTLPKGIIFDCDGVLIDSKCANISYYNSLRESFNLPFLTPAEEDFVHSTTLQIALETLIPKEHLSHIVEEIESRGFTFPTEEYVHIDSALIPVLKFLKKHSIHSAIFTNRRRQSLMKILQYFSIDTFFTPIVTPDIVPPKPHYEGLYRIASTWKIPIENLLFIGDTMADAGPAIAVSIPFFSFNNSTIPSLYNLNNFSDLLSILQNLSEEII